MKKLIVLCFAFLAMSVSAVVWGADYSVDKDHSRVGFSVRHLVSHVSGNFKDFSGTFKFDAKKPEASKVDFSINAASINTDNDKRDAHLKSPDFFDTAKFAKITFEGKKVTADGENKFKVDGDMTMHGVTKPVTFEVEYLGREKDPWGNYRAGFSATTKLNRKDFGLTWNKVLESGGMMVGDDVEVSLQIEAVEKAADKK
jgi:polyisoprenoid-binding protein YceI